MPGSSTSTLRAAGDPTLITPTLSYLAGVPGDDAPRIQETCSSARAIAVPVVTRMAQTKSAMSDGRLTGATYK